MILTLVAMLSMTTAFAEGEMAMGTSNMEAYELNINMDKLSEAQYGANDRKKLVARALDNDVKWMRYVLNEKQFRTYLTLLNSTINNRGLNK